MFSILMELQIKSKNNLKKWNRSISNWKNDGTSKVFISSAISYWLKEKKICYRKLNYCTANLFLSKRLNYNNEYLFIFTKEIFMD